MSKTTETQAHLG